MTGCCGKKMTVRVRFFAYFRDLFGGKEKIFDLDMGTKAGELLDLLGDSPARRDELSRPNLIVMINGADLASRGGPAAELREGDTVAIFPLMGGG